METFSALLALCAGNSPVTGEFPAQRPVTRSFDVCFDLRLNKRLSKRSWGWWFETPSHPLWRHCNAHRAWFCLVVVSYEPILHVKVDFNGVGKQLYDFHNFPMAGCAYPYSILSWRVLCFNSKILFSLIALSKFFNMDSFFLSYTGPILIIFKTNYEVRTTMRTTDHIRLYAESGPCDVQGRCSPHIISCLFNFPKILIY